MEYMFPSRNNEILLVNSEKLTGSVDQITNSSQEEEPPMFLQFPSPFHDDMDITTTLPNLHHHHTSTERCTTTTINSLNNPLKLINTTTNPLPSKVMKYVRKRRSIAVKKDRHSKIHTAQGLRDRRMRLSVHTARKFFDLNDMLGFDKASKTIEWLFSKSKRAIEEVTESLDSDDATLAVIKENVDCKSHMSTCETEPVVVEIQSDHESSKRPMESYPLVNFQQPQLGFVENKDNHNMKESSCFPVDYSNIYHFVKHLHLDNNVRNPDAFLGINNNNNAMSSSADCSIVDYTKTISEPPAGWLNSRNTFLGFLGGWDSENSRMGSNNGIVPTALTGNVNGENPCLGMISTSNLANFHSQNQSQ